MSIENTSVENTSVEKTSRCRVQAMALYVGTHEYTGTVSKLVL